MKDFTLDDIKQLIKASFFNEPLGHSFIDKRYQNHADVSENPFYYWRLFYHLAAFLEPRLIVELGGWQGTAAAHFAAGCSKSTVITIDHHTDPGDEINKQIMLEAEGNCDNLLYFQGWTNGKLEFRERGKHALGSAPNAWVDVYDYTTNADVDIDILFIDSWHRYEEAKMDWDVYIPLMSSPGLVICDDINGGPDGMLDFWDELPEDRFLNSKVHVGTQMGFVKI